MEYYRLFLFDDGQHIEGAHEFEAQNDEAAIKMAESWRQEGQMELWQRDRRVKHWD